MTPRHSTLNKSKKGSAATKKDNVREFSSRSRSHAAQVAEKTGRAAEEVERLPFDLSALEEEGVFVNVDASGFGLLNHRLDWQALGIRLPEDTDVAFHQPRCGVLPNRNRRRRRPTRPYTNTRTSSALPRRSSRLLPTAGFRGVHFLSSKRPSTKQS